MERVLIDHRLKTMPRSVKPELFYVLENVKRSLLCARSCYTEPISSPRFLSEFIYDGGLMVSWNAVKRNAQIFEYGAFERNKVSTLNVHRLYRDF